MTEMPNGKSPARTLILEQLDERTRCVVAEQAFEVQSESDLPSWAEDVLDGMCSVDLSKEDAAEIRRSFGLNFVGAGGKERLRAAGHLDQLSYRVHTGRELLLMLQEQKPMSVFSYYDTDDLGVICDQPFGEFVAAGRIREMRYRLKTSEGRAVNYIIYTLPLEEWRARAWILLKEAGSRERWPRIAERMEGTLLGYTDKQNDEFLDKFFPL